MDDERKFEAFRQKYPTFTSSLMNTFLARAGKSDDVDAPYFMSRMSEEAPDYALYVPFDSRVSVRDDMQKCNFQDVNSAHLATQLLLQISMQIDKEIFANEAEFTIDMLELGK